MNQGREFVETKEGRVRYRWNRKRCEMYEESKIGKVRVGGCVRMHGKRKMGQLRNVKNLNEVDES